MKPLVDIGIAVSSMQNPTWWSRNFARIIDEIQNSDTYTVNRVMAIGSALPDWNKCEAIGDYVTEFAPIEEKRRNDKTDANRAKMAKNFMQSESEWLFTLDDDTVMPAGTITKLLQSGKKFIAGLYFNPNPPKNPIAYLRNQEGIGYHALYGWTPGTLSPVDSVGMGCTLIHKDVFRAIHDAYDLRSRPNGSLFPIRKDLILDGISPTQFIGKPDMFVSGEWMFMRVDTVKEDDNRMWPYFAMEYGRTEDHHFCEMACEVGYRPWVDTTIHCEHIKSWSMTYDAYRDFQNEQDGLKK